MERLQQRIGVARVIPEHVFLEPRRPVFEAPFAVCVAPQANEQQSGKGLDPAQVLVIEE